jgi:hypothetical protein
MNNNIDNIIYFLKKNTLKSYQQAQILLNAEVQKKYFENSFDITKDKL